MGRKIKIILDLGITSPDPAEQCTADEMAAISQAYATCSDHGEVLQSSHEFVLLELALHEESDDMDFARLCLIEDATRCGVGIKRIEDEDGNKIW